MKGDGRSSHTGSIANIQINARGTRCTRAEVQWSQSARAAVRCSLLGPHRRAVTVYDFYTGALKSDHPKSAARG